MLNSKPSVNEGQRFAFDKALCTVRYHGNLQGTQGQWLGVEWDDPGRGKHDGVHKGERIFHCKSSSKTPASFVRPSRTPDDKRTILDAIKFKYARLQQRTGGNGTSVIEISGKVVEEIGFDRIQQQISVLEDLKIVLVDALGVTGLATRRSSEFDIQPAREDLAITVPQIVELDLGWNPIETWQDVADICQSLNGLRILKASGLRLRDFQIQGSTTSSISPFENILELQVNESLLQPEEIISTLHQDDRCLFPSLKTMWLSQNELKSIRTSHPGSVSETVTELYLENNLFASLDVVSDLFTLFPAIKTLSLQGNLISGLGTYDDLQENPHSYKGLETLNLASNRIADFAFVDALPVIFPNLTSLRISKTPLYDNLSSSSDASSEHHTVTGTNKVSDSSFFLTLARIPKLKNLNYTTITQRDREEGEIYYLSVAEKDITSAVTSKSLKSNITNDNPESAEKLMRTKYPRYVDLCAKYDRESILLSLQQRSNIANPMTLSDFPSQQSSAYAPGTLGSRLLNTTFYINSPSPEIPPVQTSLPLPLPLTSSGTKSPGHPQHSASNLTLPLPPNLKVYTLKSIVARHFSLLPLQFRLVYKSEELDPVRDPIDSKSATWEDWGDWDVDGDNSSPERTRDGNDGRDGSSNPPYENPGLGTSNASVLVQMKGKWNDGYMMYEGQKFKKRDVEILDGMRSWGDFVEEGVKDVKIKVEPFDSDWQNKPWDGWEELRRGSSRST